MFKFIKQKNQMDCGHSCLQMVAGFYGRKFSIEKLRELTDIGKEGVSLLGISDAAVTSPQKKYLCNLYSKWEA